MVLDKLAAVQLTGLSALTAVTVNAAWGKTNAIAQRTAGLMEQSIAMRWAGKYFIMIIFILRLIKEIFGKALLQFFTVAMEMWLMQLTAIAVLANYVPIGIALVL
jgi:hypothetical protein